MSEKASIIVNGLVEAIETHPDLGPVWDLMREDEKEEFQNDLRDSVKETIDG